MKDFDDRLKKTLKISDSNELMKLYEEIYINFYKLVFFQVGKFIKNEETIKDLTNETFILFFNNIKNIKSSIKYYLMQIARNISLNYLNKESKLTYLDSDELDYLTSEDQFESHETYKELVSDLKRVLSSKEVKIILLHSVEGYSFKEIGEKIKENPKSLNKVYERAIKKYKNSKRS